MGFIGNILWFVLGGFLGGLFWLIYGLLWCISIVGIPVGVQCFKLSALAFFPFGKEVEYGGGPVSLVCNIVWLLTSGIPLAIFHLCAGVVLAVTIVGLPFAMQMFKLAKLALMPFGSHVR